MLMPEMCAADIGIDTFSSARSSDDELACGDDKESVDASENPSLLAKWPGRRERRVGRT